MTESGTFSAADIRLLYRSTPTEFYRQVLRLSDPTARRLTIKQLVATLGGLANYVPEEFEKLIDEIDAEIRK